MPAGPHKEAASMTQGRGVESSRALADDGLVRRQSAQLKFSMQRRFIETLAAVETGAAPRSQRYPRFQ